MDIPWSFWKGASPKMKRLYSIIAIFALATLVTVLGTFVQLSASDAQTINDQINQTVISGQASGTLAQDIFVNNFSICLLMFVPIVGTGVGFFILFNTGVALGAEASIAGYSPLLGLAALMLTPIFWLEFISYSVALTESIWLFRRLWQLRWRELKWTGVFIGICALLLIVGAVVETWLINMTPRA
jgi:hypothetical protein